jgi:hypothetical protein
LSLIHASAYTYAMSRLTGRSASFASSKRVSSPNLPASELSLNVSLPELRLLLSSGNGSTCKSFKRSSISRSKSFFHAISSFCAAPFASGPNRPSSSAEAERISLSIWVGTGFLRLYEDLERTGLQPIAIRCPEGACCAPAETSGALTVRQCFLGLKVSVPGIGARLAIAKTMFAALARLSVPDPIDLEFGLSSLSEMPVDEFRVSLRELHSRCDAGVTELRRCGRDSDTDERE